MKGKKVRYYSVLFSIVFVLNIMLSVMTASVSYAASTGLTITVTDSSNQSIPQYTNSGGTKTDKIISPVKLATGATAKISYNFTGVSLSKYKFVSAANLTTVPAFPQDSAMINIDLPLPNTREAYASDIGKQNYLTTKHYEYQGKAGTASERNVSFGTPVFDGVIEQEAVTNTSNYDLGSSNNSNFYVGKVSSEPDGYAAYQQVSKDGQNVIKYNNNYYLKTKYGAFKAMKMWGYFAPKVTGSYVLGAWSDDGAYGYIIVNGAVKEFVNDWRIAPPQDRSNNTAIQLTAGKYYPIYMEWYEGCPTQAAFVPEYKLNNGSYVAIPKSELYSSKTTTPGDVAGAYFGDVSGISFPAQDGIYYIASKFVSIEGTTSGMYGPFVVDNTKPVLSNMTVTTDNANGNTWAVPGNKLTIKFTSSEVLQGNPQILINGFAATASISKDAQNNYTAIVNIGNDGSINLIGDKIISGPIVVQAAHFSDLYGNEGNPVQNSSVTYDNIAPTVAITYSANPTSTGIETIKATYSEPVKSGETPLISINQQGTSDVTLKSMAVVNSDRKTWSYDYTVNADNGSSYKDGTATVSLSTTHDAAGNISELPTGNTFTINTVKPTVELTFSSNPVSVGTEKITATYSKSIVGTPKISIIQQGSSQITSQLMTAVAGTNATTWTYDYTVSADNGTTYKDGDATVNLSTVSDAIGNTSLPPLVNKFVIDTKSPEVAISYSKNPTTVGTETITAIYTESVKSGETPFISVNQQGTSDVTSQAMVVSDTDRKKWTYNYTVNPDNGSDYKDGTATVSLTTVHDMAGNNAAPPTGTTFTIDTIAPSVTIGAPSVSVTKNNSVTYTVSYAGADKVTLNSSNVTLVKTGTADGTVTASGTGNSRTVTVNNITGDGTIKIRIASGTATDNVGNSAAAPADSTAFTVDNTAPTVSLSSTAPSNTNISPIPVTITFNEAVTGFVVGDIVLNNGTAANFSGSGTTYILNVTPIAQGPVSINIAANVVTDAAGNGNVAALQLSRNYDNIAPTATISYSTTQPTNGNVTATLNPSENVTIINNDALTTYIFTNNGLFVFQFNDVASNIGYATATVNNIDKVSPVITIGSYITTPTNQDIVVAATTNEGVLNATSHTFSENGSFDFVATDAAGNVTTRTVIINNIDKVAPVITIGSYITTPTNQDIIVTATTNEGTLNTASHTFSANGSFDFVATDAAGNVTTRTVLINNIDKVRPTPPTLSADITTPTNGNVAVTITYPSDASVKQYKIGPSGAWTAYTIPVILSENNTVYARCQDAAGNWSDESSILVNNINPVLTPGSGLDNFSISSSTGGNMTSVVQKGKFIVVLKYKVNRNGIAEITINCPIYPEKFFNFITFSRTVQDNLGNTFNIVKSTDGSNTFKLTSTTSLSTSTDFNQINLAIIAGNSVINTTSNPFYKLSIVGTTSEVQVKVVKTPKIY